jgi:hypothetical protein
MRITHLYTGDDGRSHFADLDLDVVGGAGGEFFELCSATIGFALRDLPAGYSNEFHPAPRRQIVVNLTGSGEIICGDGSRRVVGAGDILLADDTTGEGHISREISGPRRQQYVYLDPDVDVVALLTGHESG